MDLADFVNRWKKAREQALGKSLNEEESLELIPIVERDEVLRKVFLDSRRLAQSFSKYHSLSFELEDFQDLLNQAKISCFQGRWGERHGARVLDRPACSYAVKAGSFACDYWREALDGIIMGLGEEERYARHGCARHDGGPCVDVLFTEAAVKSTSEHGFGKIPEALVTELAEITEQFQVNMKTAVEFVGYSAGVLYFRFPQGTACGSGGVYKSALQSKIQSKHPYIHLQDVSPRAVLGSES